MTTLTTQGRLILDENGKTVILRGVTLPLRLCNKESKFSALRSLGVNMVNFQLNIDDFMPGATVLVDPNDPYWDTRGFPALDAALAWCSKYGLRATLTWHIWSVTPRAMNGSEIWPAPGTFLVDKALQEDWIRRWKIILPVYANNPIVIGWVPMTEPYCIRWNNPNTWKAPSGNLNATWEAIQRRAVTELKPLAPRLLIFTEWFNEPTIGAIPSTSKAFWETFGKIVYDQHSYYENQTDWKDAQMQYAAGNYSTGLTLLRAQMKAEFLQYNLPPTAGEFGFDGADPNWQRYMQDFMALCKEIGIGLSVYTFGCQRWESSFDMSSSDSTFALKEQGTIYKNFLAANPATTWGSPTPTTYSLGVSVTGTGSVTPAGGVYNSGTTVTLTATPATGYQFSGWSGDATGTNPVITLTMNSNKFVTATFTKISYTLSTSVRGNGTITLTPNQTSYAYGTTVMVSATPASDSQFVGWEGSLTGTLTTQNLVMDGNKSVTAVFELLPRPPEYFVVEDDEKIIEIKITYK